MAVISGSLEAMQDTVTSMQLCSHHEEAFTFNNTQPLILGLFPKMNLSHGYTLIST